MEIAKLTLQCHEAIKNKQGSKVIFTSKVIQGPDGQQLTDTAVNVQSIDVALADKLRIDKAYVITITEA